MSCEWGISEVPISHLGENFKKILGFLLFQLVLRLLKAFGVAFLLGL